MEEPVYVYKDNEMIIVYMLFISQMIAQLIMLT